MRRLLTFVLALAVAAPVAAAAPSSLPRLEADDLVYQGAFLLPAGGGERRTFAYGGTAIAYNAARESLFAVGHDWYQRTAEVSIPAPATAAAPGQLERGRFLQPFADATGGRLGGSGTDNKIGGQLVYRGRLYGTVFVYYDASGSQRRSHWTRSSTSLSQGRARGLFRVGRAGAGLVSGYLAEVPAAWRRALGGPALTGNCCIPIISRTSYGPAAFAFDPAKVRRGGAVRPLVYYPDAHQALGAWDSTFDAPDVLFNGSTAIRGVAFPAGTRSVLFFGQQGTGPFCYGVGGAGGECDDPDDDTHGTHAYPYQSRVWAYDANDLAAVRSGRRKPWQVRPYATWRLGLPYDASRIGGVAYDRRSGRIFVSQQFGHGDEPVIHVLAVAARRR